MTNVAILIGNTEYRYLDKLACCHDDVLAVKELLEATGKYTLIEIIENADADDLKARVREVIDALSNVGELFFYFTGHGSQQEGDFYFCATCFDDKKPNETGLSTSELHTLLRIANADLVVKVIDACNSGTLLVKRSGDFIEEKHGFTNLIQISSCLNSQSSLTGDP